MAEVVSNLSSVDERDVHAIATYMTSVFGPPTPEQIRRGDEVLAKAKSPVKSPAVPSSQTEVAGASIYAAACATCHETGRPVPYGGVNLGLSTAISGPRSAQRRQYRTIRHSAGGGRTQPDHAELCEQHGPTIRWPPC